MKNPDTLATHLVKLSGLDVILGSQGHGLKGCEGSAFFAFSFGGQPLLARKQVPFTSQLQICYTASLNASIHKDLLSVDAFIGRKLDTF